MKKFTPLLWLILLISACAPTPAWDSTTLRALDPADAAHPAADITALYTRASGPFTEIRLDLLDIPYDPALQDNQQPPLPDIYIALDTQPGGMLTWGYPQSQTASLDFSEIEYDLLAAIPARGGPVIYLADEDAGLRRAWWLFPSASVDRTADTLTLRFLTLNLPADYAMQAVTLNSIQTDQTPVVRASAQSDAHVALLLVIHDAFPAATPAQAVRRWDGAHTGPYGERHGLKHLLEAADRYNLPITLPGLAAPESLSALDYVGGAPALQALQKRGLATLPHAASGAAIPAPNESDLFQPTAQGLSLEARRAVLDAALAGQPLVWGGELAYSAWANADAAAPSMAYLAARPYIRALTPDQFTALPGAAGFAPLQPAPTLDPGPYTALIAQMPADSHITQAAQHMLTHLTAPTRDPRLRQLRALYLPDLNYFAAAAAWAHSPGPIADCARFAETCLLANDSFFAVLRQDGARLAYLFVVDAHGAHQVVGPTYQFESGMSDRSRWQPNLGQAADPGALGGAFIDSDDPWAPYRASINPNGSITFTRHDAARAKTYALAADAIRVTYAGETPPAARIGLALDPWQRFERNWGNRYGWRQAGGWGVAGGPLVSVQAEGSVSRDSFLDSRARMGQVEDPNFEYPPGHFLPFPMAVVTIPAPVEAALVIQ